MTFTPSEEQHAVIGAPLVPVRVEAGAGTGKTTTLAERIVHLVDHLDVVPDQILGITFTNKAAQELADRIRISLGDRLAPGIEVDVHTYHGFAARILHDHGALVGAERDTPVITPTYARQILLDLLGSGRYEVLDATSTRWHVPNLVKLNNDLGDNLQDAAALLAACRAADPDDPVWQERAELAATLVRYEADKRRLGVVDYPDLIRFAHRVVSEHPSVARRIATRYRIALLDEYQDTNPAQRLLLQAVFGGGFPVTAVGDPDQTIYEWRGASLVNFAGFPSHFPHGDGTPAATLPLTLNRRSGPTILRLANRIRREVDDAPRADLAPLPDAPLDYVGTAWLRTAIDEAEWIATTVRDLHADGHRWRDMAVLFRKNKDIALVRDALVEHDVPVEVASLGGLLGIPEIVDVHAWLRLLHDPADGPALARLLMGARFRLGMTDLKPLADQAARRGRDGAQDHENGRIETLIEAIDALDEAGELPESAADRLLEFRSTYRTLLRDAQGVSLVELVRRILYETEAWPEIEAMPPAARLSARLNLYRFLDLAEEWSPLEGRPSLHAFLDYLATMQDDPVEELDTARVSDEDAVTLLTVHRSKGLEWPVVFIPATFRNNFPASSRLLEDPHARSSVLPYDLRIDRASLPALDADMTDKARKELLRERHFAQEWRIAYVAATRARRRLYVSGAFWYGSPAPRKTAAAVGPLFELAAALDGVDRVVETDAPGPRPETLRYEQAGAAPDQLFVDGWDEAVRRTISEPDWPQTEAGRLGLDAAYDAAVTDFQEMLFSLPEPPSPDVEAQPLQTSVTGLVTYASCPQRFFWTEVDRLPRRPSRAARRGVEVHRRIELHNRGAVPLEEAEPGVYDVSPAESSGEPSPIDPEGVGPSSVDPFEAFRSSRLATALPRLVEAPFDLVIDGTIVRGRIDAVYEWEPGHWEIVDFKSGRAHDHPSLRVQLEAYALAVHDAGFSPEPPQRLEATFAFLGNGLEEVTQTVDAAWLAQARRHLSELTGAITDGAWDPDPGEACRSCDFTRFCPTGRAWLADAR